MRGMGYKDFLQLDSPASKDEIVCTFRVEQDPSVEFAWAAGALAAESSIGTWDPGLTTMTEEARKHGARVVKLDEAKKLAWVAYPQSLFEAGNLARQLGERDREGLLLVQAGDLDDELHGILSPASLRPRALDRPSRTMPSASLTKRGPAVALSSSLPAGAMSRRTCHCSLRKRRREVRGWRR